VTRLVGRTGRYALSVSAAVLVLAACGDRGDGVTIADPAPSTATAAPTTTSSAPGSGRPSTAPSPPEQPTPSTDRCHTAELAVAFGPEQAGAGQRMGSVILQNVSTRTCTVYGYGGLQLLDAQKRPLPNGLTREPTPLPTLQSVPPGGKVSKDISFTVIPSGAETCPTPTWAQVTPPDETGNQVEHWPYGPVCGAVKGRAYRQSTGY
jgi:hypothetical protein